MMKMNFFLIFATSLFLLGSCTNAPKSDEAATSEAKEVTENAAGEVFTLDTALSKVEWIGTKVSGYHTGTIKISGGELIVKDGAISGGKFNLYMNSIVTSGPKGSSEEGNAKLTGHLKSPDFFDVTKYPDATFEITSVKPFTGTVTEVEDARQEEISEYKVTNPTHTVSGNLTMKDVTKNIEFPALITISENSAEAMAKFNIDRSLWNIVYPGKPDDLIRNEIHLGISLKGNK